MKTGKCANLKLGQQRMPVQNTVVEVEKGLKYKLWQHKSPGGKHPQRILKHSMHQYPHLYKGQVKRICTLDLINLKRWRLTKESGIEVQSTK